jgi:hypothetical protein
MRLNDTRRHFLDRDAFLLGIVLGLALPVMVYGVLLTIYDALELRLLASDVGFSPDFRFRTLSLVAICSNLILFHLYRRWHRDNTMRGLVLPTMGYMIYWFWTYGRNLVGL